MIHSIGTRGISYVIENMENLCVNSNRVLEKELN